jgi:hypothetical protein
LNLLLELGEGRGVGALVLFKELEDLLDTLTVELKADGVEVLTLVSPEVKFNVGVGVVTHLERVFGVLLEDVLDLTAPLDNGVLEDDGLVLGRSSVGGSDVTLGKRKDGLSLDQTDGDHCVCKEAVELVHEVLAHQVTPSNLVEGVAENGKEYTLKT